MEMKYPLFIRYSIATILLGMNILPGDAQCPVKEYLYTRNNTCLQCPFTCQSCMATSVDTNYPCINCQSGYGYILSPHASGSGNGAVYGGSCVPCSSILKIFSKGTRRLALNPPSGVNEYGGRLEIFYSGKWWTVCDDGWTDANTNVVCKELDMGTGTRFYTNYDKRYPGQLPEKGILFDDTVCKSTDESLFDCAHTAIGKDSCEKTETVGIQCSGPKNRLRCVTECPVGQYSDQSTKECTQCVERCLKCKGTALSCMLCEEPFFLLTNGSCVLNCPSGSYGNTRRRTCDRCNNQCLTCADGESNTICLSCPSNTFLYGSKCLSSCPQSTYLIQKQNKPSSCVTLCPGGFYDNGNRCSECGSSCLTCFNEPTNCTSCSEGFVLTMNSGTASCQRGCPNGHWVNVRNVCEPCNDQGCRACYSGGQYCRKCENGLLLQLGSCVSKCTHGFYEDNDACTDRCQDGFYGDVEKGVCHNCHALCRRCSGPEVTSCLACYEQYYLKADSCVRDCAEMVSISTTHNREVRLVGGTSSLDGRVEIHYNGVWGHICAENGWSLSEGDVVCHQLNLGQALQVTNDTRYGAATQAMAKDMRCEGKEQSLLDCPNDVPTLFASCVHTVGGVRCSGPDLSAGQTCRRRNTEMCERSPCSPGVQCTDLPQNSGSYCADCPQGTVGDGIFCQSVPSESVLDILIPHEDRIPISDWPEDVDLRLPCVPNIHTGVSIAWLRDGTRLKSGIGMRLESDGALTLFPPNASFSGMYECYVTNGRSEKRRFFYVTFQERVRVVRQPQPFSGSGNFTMDCVHRGNPSPQVKWYKDGVEIDIKGTRQEFYALSPGGSLTVSGGMAFHAGLYTCQVSNNYTFDSASATVVLSGPPLIWNKQHEVVAVLDRRLEVTCLAGGVPQPRTYWKQNGRDLTNTSSLSVYPNGTFVRQKVGRGGGGLFKCVARGQNGEVDTWEPQIVITVHPMAQIWPTTLSSSVGTSATFSCETSGDPQPSVNWESPAHGELDQTNRPSGVRVGMNTAASEDSFTILSVKETDAGTVSCIASSKAGVKRSSAQLFVKVPPKFMVVPSDISVFSGLPIFINWTLGLYGLPEPEVLWSHDGNDLSSKEGINITSDGVLFVPRWPDDSGRYMYRASNSEGVLQQSAIIDVVRDYPAPRLVRSHQTNCTLKIDDAVEREKPNHVYEIWVGLVSDNTSAEFEEIPTSPIDLEYVTPNLTANGSVPFSEMMMKVYLVMVFDTLPRELIIGDREEYTSNTLELTVKNYELLSDHRYGVTLRILKSSGTVTSVVGATHYIYITSVIFGVGGGLPEWALALIIVVALLVVAALLLTLLRYLQKRGYLEECSSLEHILQISQSFRKSNDGIPIDVDGYLDQFSPHPSPSPLESEYPTHFKADYSDDLVGSHANMSSYPSFINSPSGAYIPTEDEIEAMEKIGINYYEDEHWLQRVPDGVLAVSGNDLVRLKSWSEEFRLNDFRPRAESLSKSNSDPNLTHLQSPPASLSKRLCRRLSLDPKLNRSAVDMNPAGIEDLAEGEDRTRRGVRGGSSISTQSATASYTASSVEKSVVNRMSSHTDSGFESEQLQRFTQPVMLTDPYREFERKKSVNVRHSDSSSSKNDDVLGVRRSKDRRRKGRSKKIGKFKEKSLEILSSFGRKWQFHPEEEDYVADNSAESESNTPKRPSTHPAKRNLPPINNRRVSVDTIDNAYIDPSKIVSVPRATSRMRELQHHNSPIESPDIQPPKLLHITEALIHRRRSTMLGSSQLPSPDLSADNLRFPSTSTEGLESPPALSHPSSLDDLVAKNISAIDSSERASNIVVEDSPEKVSKEVADDEAGTTAAGEEQGFGFDRNSLHVSSTPLESTSPGPSLSTSASGATLSGGASKAGDLSSVSHTPVPAESPPILTHSTQSNTHDPELESESRTVSRSPSSAKSDVRSQHSYLSLVKDPDEKMFFCNMCNMEHPPIWQLVHAGHELVEGGHPPPIPPRPCTPAKPPASEKKTEDETASSDVPDGSTRVQVSDEKALDSTPPLPPRSKGGIISPGPPLPPRWTNQQKDPTFTYRTPADAAPPLPPRNAGFNFGSIYDNINNARLVERLALERPETPVGNIKHINTEYISGQAKPMPKIQQAEMNEPLYAGQELVDSAESLKQHSIYNDYQQLKVENITQQEKTLVPEQIDLKSEELLLRRAIEDNKQLSRLDLDNLVSNLLKARGYDVRLNSIESDSPPLDDQPKSTLSPIEEGDYNKQISLHTLQDNTKDETGNKAMDKENLDTIHGLVKDQSESKQAMGLLGQSSDFQLSGKVIGQFGHTPEELPVIKKSKVNPNIQSAAKRPKPNRLRIPDIFQ